MTCNIDKKELNNFIGSENIYSGYMGIKYTDGCKYFIDNEASWLISDMAVICKVKKEVKAEPFISIHSIVKNNKAEVIYTDGNNKTLFIQKYSYTDLPTGQYDFYFTDNTLLLTTEY
jgi:hypothetical protein